MLLLSALGLKCFFWLGLQQSACLGDVSTCGSSYCSVWVWLGPQLEGCPATAGTEQNFDSITWLLQTKLVGAFL